MSNVEFFEHWLTGAPAGQSWCYHQGYLAVDREQFGGSEVAALAQRAWRASEEGFVLLTQRRLGEGSYEYLATRTAEILG